MPRPTAKIRHLIKRFDIDVNPTITAEAAVAIAKSVSVNQELTKAPQLKILPSNSDASGQLIYWVDISSNGLKPGADVLINAHTGQLIANISKMETLAPIQVMSAKGQGAGIEQIVAKDPNSNLLAGRNPNDDQTGLQYCVINDFDKQTTSQISAQKCLSILQGKRKFGNGKCQVVMSIADTDGTPLSEGDPVMLNPSACQQVVQNSSASADADQSALNALSNTQKVLTYYQDVHGRDGLTMLAAKL